MKLFVAKLKYKNGDRAHPWTLFAPSYAEAVRRLETGAYEDEFSEIAVKEVDNASHFGRDASKPDNAILEHPEIEWRAG
ncbi:hypothetical protein CN159_02155 [Sinorhizobium meliloti]|uniref:hypothetical protein n=1 Tax=Rhizobium meliloti TaxID=382 RepID=UPI000FD9E847|nr:hypothetical protein [Sinorhizobium meliloti]RVK73175.1 hypothetical protein CN159_02155 [Sinorhizobium meliloti]